MGKRIPVPLFDKVIGVTYDPTTHAVYDRVTQVAVDREVMRVVLDPLAHRIKPEELRQARRHLLAALAAPTEEEPK